MLNSSSNLPRKRSNRNSLHQSTSADDSKSWQGQQLQLSPASSVTSGISIKSLPAHQSLPKEERKRINDEAYEAWKNTKAKQETKRREKVKKEQEKKEREKEEKELKQKKFEEENRSQWLLNKQLLADATKRKEREAQKKIEQDKEELRQFSKDMVATWMTVAKSRSKPVKGGVFECPRLSYKNPIPWIGVLEDT